MALAMTGRRSRGRTLGGVAERVTARSSEHLISLEARERLRTRLGVGDWLVEHRWLATGFGSVLTGMSGFAAALLGGLTSGDALWIGRG